MNYFQINNLFARNATYLTKAKCEFMPNSEDPSMHKTTNTSKNLK